MSLSLQGSMLSPSHCVCASNGLCRYVTGQELRSVVSAAHVQQKSTHWRALLLTLVPSHLLQRDDVAVADAVPERHLDDSAIECVQSGMIRQRFGGERLQFRSVHDVKPSKELGAVAGAEVEKGREQQCLQKLTECSAPGSC